MEPTLCEWSPSDCLPMTRFEMPFNMVDMRWVCDMVENCVVFECSSMLETAGSLFEDSAALQLLSFDRDASRSDTPVPSLSLMAGGPCLPGVGKDWLFAGTASGALAILLKRGAA